MSQEPNRKIDELLKGYVQRRQKDEPADFEMPFAVRRSLQKEIARQRPERIPKETKWRRLFWVRAGLAASFLVAIIGICLAAFSIRSRPETPIAGASSPERSTQPGIAPPARETMGRKLTESYSETNLNTLVSEGRFTTLEVQGYKPAATGVLTSFDFQKSGPAIQIVDADGSVYSGALVTPLKATTANAANVTMEMRQVSGMAMPLKAAAANASLNKPVLNRGISRVPYQFQASGTNLTLQQQVSLTGEVRQFDGIPPDVASAPLGEVTIQGTALVGTTNRIEIKAISTQAK